jgi:hypothetical protein
LAHQQTGQLSHGLLREILGNVTTLIAFNVSHDDAVKLSKEFVVEMGVESEYLPPEELLRLKVGEAWGKIGKTIFPLRTKLADQPPDFMRAKEVIERSRFQYGVAAVVRNPRTTRVNQEMPPEIDPAKVF